MKLSASSRAYVAEQVKECFVEDLRAAEKAVEEAKEALNGRFEKFEKDLSKLSDGWMDEVEKLVKRHGLHWAKGKGRDAGAHVQVLDGHSSYRDVDGDSFVETADKTAVFEAEWARRDVIDRIEKAVRKALYEIEVHGRKSDLEDIVRRVVAEARNEKKGE